MKNKYVKYSMFFIGIIVSVICAVILGTTKTKDVVLSSLSYVENDNSTYKVYYDNPFYNKDDYLDEGKSYINTIDVDFDYLLNFTDKISGRYEYTMNAVLSVFEPGNPSNDYWSKKYELGNSELINIDSKTVEVKKNIQIAYQDYVKDYLDYKSSNAIATNAKLIVSMVVSFNGEYKGLDKFADTKTIYLEVPVSEPTFSITKNNNLSKSAIEFTKTEDNSNKRNSAAVLSLSCWGVALLLGILFIIIYSHDSREDSEYAKKLKKILNTYDSIIVNVDKLESLENVSIAKVTSFEELLDYQLTSKKIKRKKLQNLY